MSCSGSWSGPYKVIVRGVPCLAASERSPAAVIIQGCISCRRGLISRRREALILKFWPLATSQRVNRDNREEYELARISLPSALKARRRIGFLNPSSGGGSNSGWPVV